MDDAVRIVTTAQTPTAVVAETTSWDEFPLLWRRLLAEVWAVCAFGPDRGPQRHAVQGRRAERRGRRRGERAVRSERQGGGLTLPAGRAATAVARGEPSPASLAAPTPPFASGARQNGHDLTGVRWEIYGHWREDQDQALFETEVYWLLAE